MDASARGDGLNMHMPPRDQRKRAPSAEPPGSTATRGRGGEGRKKAKPEWPPVEPGQEYEYVFTGTESAIAKTYTQETMQRLKGQKVKALCEKNAEGTGKQAVSISGGPSGANAVNFVRSAASWWLRTNGTPDKGKGQRCLMLRQRHSVRTHARTLALLDIVEDKRSQPSTSMAF